MKIIWHFGFSYYFHIICIFLRNQPNASFPYNLEVTTIPKWFNFKKGKQFQNGPSIIHTLVYL